MTNFNRNPTGKGGKTFDLGRHQVPPSDLEHVKVAQKAYWGTKCSLCGSKALYRAGRKVFCKEHKHIASAWWANHPMQIDFGKV